MRSYRLKLSIKTVSILLLGFYFLKTYMLWTEPMRERVLRPEGDQFYLNGQPFRILSGSMHYFRVVPEYWRDRLLKLKAMGLNTVQTYVPWNLHEEIKGEFKFDGILDVAGFIKLAHSIGLYVIVRPGPFICGEWEFGGFPSWLLHDANMKLRSTYPPYLAAVDSWFKKLCKILVPLQFSYGGPIIAFQIENEYASYSDRLSSEYMVHLRNVMMKEGLIELMFTSDNLWEMERKKYYLPGVMLTVNLQKDEVDSLKRLKTLQPDRPLMVAEFWPGWFDNWGDGHHKMDLGKVLTRVSNILKAGASVNLYMFHGGTNFGFMNGAIVIPWIRQFSYQPAVTSYDYDAPLSEAGDITSKFWALRNILRLYNSDIEEQVPESLLHSEREAYDAVQVEQYLTLPDIAPFFISIDNDKVMPMEMLPINNNGGQGYGFILYRTELHQAAEEITIHNISDNAQVLIDGQVIYRTNVMKQGTWKNIHYMDQTELWKVNVKMNNTGKDLTGMYLLDILVENMGRSNILPVMDTQRKVSPFMKCTGILGDVFKDGMMISKWKMVAMEFKQEFFDNLRNSSPSWKKVTEWNKLSPPQLFRATFNIDIEPKDTFLHMKDWTKGVVFINGHNLGRYWDLGPQETLYIPSPWLQKGLNELLVFELENCKQPQVLFSLEPKLKGKIHYQT
ncbi:beta-galactosidase-1-like protein 2 isoform X3 [Acropora palmata]|uniref:beta-galactosidase-1-like protein 2 isoform X3 n=1 Tax=Acropora palmata TaxID=6131 RepID=UPI003DA059A8